MGKKEKKRMEAEIRAKRAFAEMRAKVGRGISDANVEAARQRLRQALADAIGFPYNG